MPRMPGPLGSATVCDYSKTDKQVIKGNIEPRAGEQIYHVPGGFFYSTTVISASDGDRWFCTEEEALEAGCEPSAELVAPLALAYALTGDWPKALQRSAKVDTDPTGKAILARLSAQAAMGDVQPLLDATSGPDGERLLAQVMLVLRRGGANVEAIRAALDGTGSD